MAFHPALATRHWARPLKPPPDHHPTSAELGIRLSIGGKPRLERQRRNALEAAALAQNLVSGAVCLATPCSNNADFTGLNDASQRACHWLWRTPCQHPYVAWRRGDFRAAAGIHRALKKSAFLAVFAFDLPKPRTYNPRPRCFAVVAVKCVIPLNSDVKIVTAALFDIVISGRGTWAAARYATTSRLRLWRVRLIEQRRLNARVLLQDKN